MSSIKKVKGVRYERSCELNIEANVNYFHKMSCKLQTPSLPTQTIFGYSIKAANYKEGLFGKFDNEYEVTLPTGRVIKVERQVLLASPLNANFDQDDDNNNDREFNSTTKFFWNFAADPKKFITMKAKRDNYGGTNSKFTIEVLDYPGVRSSKVTLDRQRLPDETAISLIAAYELDSSAKNQLEFSVKMASDLKTNSLSTEFNLQKPKFNVAYNNRFNKHTGRLQHLGLRLASLLQFTVEKDDPENRKISVSLVSPDESQYTASSKVLNSFSRHYSVESTLVEKSTGSVLSKLVSTFDKDNNEFVIDVDTVRAGQTYKLNLGIVNETFANGVLFRNKQKVGVSSLGVVGHDDHKDLVLSLRWNRVWTEFKENVLGLPTPRMAPNAEFNSYFGDVYSNLRDDLKPVVDSLRAEYRALRQDVVGSLGLYVEYYKYYLPQQYQTMLSDAMKARKAATESEEKEGESSPLYKRLFAKYNNLAQLLQSLHMKVRSMSKNLAKYVPRLPLMRYNTDPSSSFANNLIISRPTYNAHTLYQFNAEYREYVRVLANRVSTIKGNFIRDTGAFGLRALWNKYKLRSLRSWTMIGHVYNRRNVLAFNGELNQLKSKCRFLLAHELSRNQFSVILNNNDQVGIISVSAYGQPAIDINGNQAFIDNKAIALPHVLNLEAKKAQISVRRTHNSVSVQVNDDLLVTCYEDSKSCTVALSRWYTGKVNGLLGRSRHDLANVEEKYWFLDSQCKLVTGVNKTPSEEAVKVCYGVFGKHRFSSFRDALVAIKPNGWQKLCESAVNADANAKCTVMKAFTHHARNYQIEVREPNECCK